MTSLVQVAAIVVSSLLLVLVVELVRRRKLTEEYSLIWILCAVALLALSIRREIIHSVASWLGVFYPPAVLLLVLIAFVFTAALYFSVVVSRQRQQIERLVEELALLAGEQREFDRRLSHDAAAGPGRMRHRPGRPGLPAVTICVPTYNGAAYLRQALDSALAQTLDALEVVIVDDRSTDDSIRIAEEYVRRDARVRLHLNRHNMGLASNWNRCAQLAQAEWIKFLFQDDLLDPQCVERMLAAATDGGRFIACRHRPLVDDAVPDAVRREYLAHLASIEQRQAGARPSHPAEFAVHLIDEPIDNCIGEPTVTLIDRNLLLRSGGFHPHLIQLLDWECWARLGLQSGVVYVDEPLATFRFHNQSTTAANMRTRPYQKNVIDPLIIHHEIAHAPAYELVRIAAGRRVPPVDLTARLAAAAAEARRSAAAGDPNWAPDAPAAWEEAVRRYPSLCAT